MTATMHISRRTTPHHPLTALRARWDAFQLRHNRRVQTVTFQRLHDTLPLDDPDRYALESPALERALQQLATDHGDLVTPTDGGALARDIDREQLLLATCDAWFRDLQGPEHRWSPRTLTAYNRLLADVRDCFHPSGGAQ
ncbi:hypothetical protein [Streptomyces mirabilis]|uniref:hypothetical protein n=1 Tax=Streptomyces mirabilis TaxID=68239 RepID=UPI00369C515A